MPSARQRSNCTFMELKYVKEAEFIEKAQSSNCTFMELKLRQLPGMAPEVGVLIVPLWN